jgi:hypothetical protein
LNDRPGWGLNFIEFASKQPKFVGDRRANLLGGDRDIEFYIRRGKGGILASRIVRFDNQANRPIEGAWSNEGVLGGRFGRIKLLN